MKIKEILKRVDKSEKFESGVYLGNLSEKLNLGCYINNEEQGRLKAYFIGNW